MGGKLVRRLRTIFKHLNIFNGDVKFNQKLASNNLQQVNAEEPEEGIVPRADVKMAEHVSKIGINSEAMEESNQR